MSKLLWQMAEGGIKILRDMDMHVYHVTPEDPTDDHVPRKGPEDRHITHQRQQEYAGERRTSVRNKLGGAPLSRSGLTAGAVVTELDCPVAVGMMGTWNNRDQVAALYCLKPRGSNLHNNQAGQSCSQGALIHRELWRWLIEHGIQGAK